MYSTEEKAQREKEIKAEEMVRLAHEHMERLTLKVRQDAREDQPSHEPISDDRHWDDIVFERRNQEYGAYVLRKGYANAVTIGFGVTLFILLAILLAGPVSALLKGNEKKEAVEPRKLVYTELSAPPPIDKPKPPPPQIQLPRLQKVIKFVPPRVVREQVVEEVPTIEEIKQNETASVAADGPTTVTFDEPVAEAFEGNDDEIFTVVEQNPEFPGGYDAMMAFVKQNMKYPANARRMDIEGTVYVGFVVNKDGTISDVKVLRGIMTECDNEAIRVIKAMPPWKPGKQNGRNVNVRFTVPLKFRLH